MAEQNFITLVQKLSHFDKKSLATVIEFVEQMESNNAMQVSPQPKVRRDPQFGSAKGKYILSDDFDAPLDDFKDYVK